jgi:hypothetical protein
MLCESQAFGQRCRKEVSAEGKHLDGTRLHFARWEQPLEWTDNFAKMVAASPTPGEKKIAEEAIGDGVLAEITGRLNQMPHRFAIGFMADAARGLTASLNPGPEKEEAIELMDRFSALYIRLGDRPS